MKSSVLPPPSPEDPPLSPPPQAARAQAPAAAWLATAGALLVLVAAGVLVVGNWTHIAPVYKLGGLMAFDGIVLAVAHLLRRSSPVVARTLAHLGATMAVPAGVAFVASAHGRWPMAIAVGGFLGVLACLAQANRWTAPKLIPAAEAAGVLGLAGVAALTHTPVGVLVAVASVGLLAARRPPSAARLAGVAAAGPVLAVLAASDIGPGTMVRLGAAGSVVHWAAPVAGLLAGIVLLMLARRRRSMELAVAGMLSVATAVPTGMIGVQDSGWMWMCLPGLALLAIVGMRSLRDVFWKPIATDLGSLAEAIVLIGGIPAVVGLVASNWADPKVDTWAIVAATNLAGAVAVTIARKRSMHTGTPPTTEPHIVAPATTEPYIVAPATTEPHIVAPATTGSRLAPQPTTGPQPAVGPLPAPGTDEYAARFVRAARDNSRLIAAGLGMVCLVIMAAFANVVTTWPIAASVALLGVLTVGLIRPKWSSQAEIVVALGLIAVNTATRAHADSPRKLGTTVLVGAIVMVVWSSRGRGLAQRVGAIVAAGLAISYGIDGMWPHDRWTGASVLALMLAMCAVAELPLVSLAGLPTLAAVISLTAQVGSIPTVIGLLIAAVMLLGSATVVNNQRLDVLTAAAVATAAIGAFVVHDGLFVSMGLGLIGITMVLYGAVRQDRLTWLWGQVVVGVASCSLVFTSGFARWAGQRAEQIGLRPADLAVSLGVILLLSAGFWIRHARIASSSWVAYGPGLLLAGAHLVSTEIASPQSGRLATALALGIVAMTIGGWRRLGAPLVIGSGLTIIALVTSFGHELAALPVWAWIATGGVLLLAVAGLIERRTPANTATGEPGRRLVQVVWQQFA